MSEYLFSWRKIPEQQYMYLVHAISSGLQAAVGLSHIRKQWLINNSFAINLLTELDKYCQKPIVSTSLISHNKHATRAKSWLIINAPKETIINAGSHDLWTAYDGSWASNTQYGVVSPNTLINQSCPTWHNEVVVSNKGVVKSSVQWFFIKVDEYWYPLDWDYRALKNHLAEKYWKQHPSNNWLQKVWDMWRNLFEHCQSDTIVAMAKQHKKPLVLIIEKDWARKEYMYPKIREELWLQEWLY